MSSRTRRAPRRSASSATTCGSTTGRACSTSRAYRLALASLRLPHPVDASRLRSVGSSALHSRRAVPSAEDWADQAGAKSARVEARQPCRVRQLAPAADGRPRTRNGDLRILRPGHQPLTPGRSVEVPAREVGRVADDDVAGPCGSRVSRSRRDSNSCLSGPKTPATRTRRAPALSVRSPSEVPA